MTQAEKNKYVELGKTIVNRLPTFCHESEIYNYDDFYKEPELFEYWVKLPLEKFDILVSSGFIIKDRLNILLKNLQNNLDISK